MNLSLEINLTAVSGAIAVVTTSALIGFTAHGPDGIGFLPFCIVLATSFITTFITIQGLLTVLTKNRSEKKIEGE